jgi:hypothetical protein
LDISGWKLGGAVDFTFARGTVVPAASSIYVSPNVRAFRARAVSPRGHEGRFVVGPYSGHLSAGGETIKVRNSAGVVVDSYTFAAEAGPKLKLAVNDGGSVTLTFQAVANQSYTIELTDSLGTPWQRLRDFDAAAGGVVTATDVLATGHRFYRLVTPKRTP